jgi:hypothetical protein
MIKKKQDIIKELEEMEEYFLGNSLPLKPVFNLIKKRKNQYTLFIEVNGFKNREQVKRFIALSVNDPDHKITEGTLH